MSEAGRRRRKLILRLCIYGGIALLAGGYFFLCQNGYGLPCFYYEHFHRQCISCGASRAAMAMVQLDFGAAIGYNPVFTLAIYPILGLIIIQDVAVCITNLATGREQMSFLQFVCSGALRAAERRGAKERLEREQ